MEQDGQGISVMCPNCGHPIVGLREVSRLIKQVKGVVALWDEMTSQDGRQEAAALALRIGGTDPD